MGSLAVVVECFVSLALKSTYGEWSINITFMYVCMYVRVFDLFIPVEFPSAIIAMEYSGPVSLLHSLVIFNSLQISTVYRM